MLVLIKRILTTVLFGDEYSPITGPQITITRPNSLVLSRSGNLCL